jgi:Ca2+-binding RTX toxin-like protein
MTTTISGTPGADTLLGDTNGADLNDFIDGMGGSDTLSGLTGNDTLRGGAGNDSLNGGLGNDSLDGNVGNDRMRGGGGNDTAMGGDGDDTLFVGPEGGTIGLFDGGAGYDVLDGSAATATLHVTALVGVEKIILTKFDDIWGGTAASELFVLGLGNDQVNGGDGDDTLLGGDGNDHLAGSFGNDSVDGGAGFDYAYFIAAPESLVANLSTGKVKGFGKDTVVNIEGLVGSTHDDKLTGDGFDNVFVGLEGDDRIDGAGGIDAVSYGTSSSGVGVNLTSGQVSGDLGNDRLFIIENVVGGAGADGIVGNAQNNAMFGAAGNDSLTGNGGNDSLGGGDGNDVIDGGAGMDTLLGGVLNDILVGGAQADTLYGESGNDSLEGGAGRDFLTADEGLDTLRGGAGGGDTLEGGAGKDLFIWSNADVTDAWTVVRITDFDASTDVISLQSIDADSAKTGNQAFKVVAAFTGKAGEMVLTFDAGANTTRVDCQTDADAAPEFSLVINGHLTDATGFVL